MECNVVGKEIGEREKNIFTHKPFPINVGISTNKILKFDTLCKYL